MGSAPFISVIVCAHNRKEFLQDAVQSAINQSLPRENYEIIVVKNFEDDIIDKFLNENGIINIISQAQNLSNKQAVGIRKSKGDVICFLDDDDLFENEKLKRVTFEFSREKRLSFLHNGMIFIDTKGREVARGNSFVEISYDSSNFHKRVIQSLLSQMASYNPSSMSLSRELAHKYLDQLDETFREVDTFWFGSALDLGGKILAIPDYLTKYRRHEGGLSRASDPSKTLKYAESALENLLLLERFFITESAKSYIEFKKFEWHLKIELFKTHRNSLPQILKTLYTLFHYWNIAPTRDILKLSSLLLLSSVSRTRAITLYPKFYS